jgi:DNA-binding Lrp family transcriptional regulator
MELDRFDRQLLNLVQADSAQTAERLAEQVELSPSAIQRRLRRLRDEGVIVRECAILDPSVIGRPTRFSWHAWCAKIPTCADSTLTWR